MRGLDSTCTVPCDSRKDISAAKLLVWKARPNSEPPVVAAVPIAAPGMAVSAPAASEVAVPPAPSGVSEEPGDSRPVDSLLLTRLAKIDQLMPLWKPLFSCTSRIFASRITWRSTDSWVAFRYRSTLRSSSGMARITITPDCGLMTTLRPSLSPMMAPSDAFSSVQKSLAVVVLTLLESRTWPDWPDWPFWPPCWPFWPPEVSVGWLLPLLPLPLLPLLLPLLKVPTLDTEVDDTRKLDEPLRAELR